MRTFEFHETEDERHTRMIMNVPRPTVRQLARAELDKMLPDIIFDLIEKAKEGDMYAQRAILDKCLGNIKPVAEATPRMPKNLTADDIVNAMAYGTIDSEEAHKQMTVLKLRAEIHQQAELVERLEALERMVDK